MTDKPQDLPELRSGVLDDNGVVALFRDIRTLTRVDGIVVKDRPGRVGNGSSVCLEEAERLVLAREVRGVQIRYHHDGAEWWDTLMCAPDGVRLVRIRHDADT